MDIKEKANQYHDKGFNCAQAVLCSCAQYTGLDERTALSIAGGLGGGCRCGEICGAVSGAVLVAGMCCPYVDEKDLDTKEKIASLSRSITGEFKQKFGYLRCEDIKGNNHSCAEYISFSAETAEKTVKKLLNIT